MGMLDELKAGIEETNALLSKIGKDEEAVRDLRTILSAAAPLYAEAGRRSGIGEGLKNVFNDVAKVLPFVDKVLEKKKIPTNPFELMKIGPTLLRLGKNNGPDRQSAFNDAAIRKGLLEKENVQTALERTLMKGIGQESFVLEQTDGNSFAIEQLSGIGIKIPLREDAYNRVKAAREAGKNGPGA